MDWHKGLKQTWKSILVILQIENQWHVCNMILWQMWGQMWHCILIRSMPFSLHNTATVIHMLKMHINKPCVALAVALCHAHLCLFIVYILACAFNKNVVCEWIRQWFSVKAVKARMLCSMIFINRGEKRERQCWRKGEKQKQIKEETLVLMCVVENEEENKWTVFQS